MIWIPFIVPEYILKVHTKHPEYVHILSSHVFLPHIKCFPHTKIRECFYLDELRVMMEFLLPLTERGKLCLPIVDMGHTKLTDRKMIWFVNIWVRNNPKGPKRNIEIKCNQSMIHYLKLVSAIFYQIIIFSPNDNSSKTMKMFFISSKKLFSFSRYSNFCSFFPSFPHFPDSKGQMEVE